MFTKQSTIHTVFLATLVCFIMCFMGFSLGFAGGNHSHSHDTEQSSADMSEDTHHSESMGEHMEEEGHDHADHVDDAHDHAEHMGTASLARDFHLLELGEQQVAVIPLIANGRLQLAVEAEGEISVGVSAPDGTMVEGSNPLDLGGLQAGTYGITIEQGEHQVASNIALYQLVENDIDLWLGFSPAPSMSSRGQSELFLYAFEQGEAIHKDITVNYVMEGMVHADDDLMTLLRHEHFEDAYNSEDFMPMANRASIAFAMLGEWQFSVMVADEHYQLAVHVLDN